MIYEHENVPEPTCEGWWWRRGDGGPVRVRCLPSTKWQFKRGACWTYTAKYDRWTGPIPAPLDAEDDPTPQKLSAGRKYQIEVKCAIVTRSAPSKEDDVTREARAREEDEGEKWGRLLYLTRFEEGSWEESTETTRNLWTSIALRFRAKLEERDAD